MSSPRPRKDARGRNLDPSPHRGEPDSTPSRVALIALILIALTVVVFTGVWSFDFVQFDDPEYIVNNHAIANGVTWPGIQWAFTTGHAANWHPLTWLSHMLDVELFGIRSGPAHVVNLVLHLANTALLFWFLATVTRSPGRSAVVAAFFAIHPLHVESVAWVSERKDVLSTLFWMLTLRAYLSYTRNTTWRRYVLVLVSFALGLMAKPMLVTLPFTLLLLDVWPLGRLLHDGQPWRQRAWMLVREKLPLFALALAAGIATILAQSRGGTMATLSLISPMLRIENALVSYATYLVKMVWPVRLFMYYPYPQSIPMWEVAASVLLLVGISAGVFLLRKSRLYLAVGWLWYLGTLLPVIGLMQVGQQAMADRFTYVPFIGVFIAVVWGAADLLSQWPSRRWLASLVTVGVLAPLAVVAHSQAQHWRNDSALWTHALETGLGLDSRRAQLAVGVLLAENKAGPMQTLLFAATGGGSVFPPIARNHLGKLFAQQNHLDEAEVSYREAIQLAPDVAEFHSDLADVLSRQRRNAEAAGEYAKALRIKPELMQAHAGLGILLAGQSKFNEAVPHFAEAVRLRPDLPESHRNLGLALGNAGRFDEAIAALREALRLRPGDPMAQRLLDDYARRIKVPR